jgi:hypothetical protein
MIFCLIKLAKQGQRIRTKNKKISGKHLKNKGISCILIEVAGNGHFEFLNT